jgi:hypothetical protein
MPLKKMKAIVVLLFVSVLLSVQCLGQTMGIKDVERINDTLAKVEILPIKMLQEVNTQLNRVKRNLTKEEYLLILRQITWELIPEEVKKIDSLDQVANNFARSVQDKNIVEQMETRADWTMPFPETFGALWMDVRTFESGRRYAEKVLDVFRVKQIIG